MYSHLSGSSYFYKSLIRPEPHSRVDSGFESLIHSPRDHSYHVLKFLPPISWFSPFFRGKRQSDRVAYSPTMGMIIFCSEKSDGSNPTFSYSNSTDTQKQVIIHASARRLNDCCCCYLTAVAQLKSLCQKLLIQSVKWQPITSTH